MIFFHSTLPKKRFVFRFFLLFLFSFLATNFSSLACVSLDLPPKGTLEKSQNGILEDPKKPLLLHFDKEIVPESLDIKVVLLAQDEEGNLGDKDDDPATALTVLFAYNRIDGETNGSIQFLDENTSVQITPKTPFPVGTRLSLLIEPGLKNRAGVATTVRSRENFNYDFKCKGSGSKILYSGNYFFLLEVTKPVGTQVQFFAKILIDEATGEFKARFTSADRNPNSKRCSIFCSNDRVCITRPVERCDLPSAEAGSVEDYVDFVPAASPPVGYSLLVDGCVQDVSDTEAILLTRSTDLQIPFPAVKVIGLTIVSSFTKGKNGVLLATGSGVGSETLVGSQPSGPTRADLTARYILPGDYPPDVEQAADP